MKRFNVSILALFLSVARAAADCSGQNNRWSAPQTRGRCTNWPEDENMEYPNEFGGIFSEVKTYICEESGFRIVVSNAIPDHDATIHRTTQACEVPYAVKLPLDPENPDMNAADQDRTEVPIRGMIAIAKNGVPAFGPQESDGYNAVEATVSNKFEAGYWYGHPGKSNGWHVHNPQMGVEAVNSETFLGWALDGFPIYGPLDDVGNLDVCNGQIVNGKYQYHVRTKGQVDQNLEYCNGDSPVTRWNYIVGCYAGDISETEVKDATKWEMPADCVLESKGDCTDNPEYGRNGDPDKNCAWVAARPKARCALDENVPINCPAACTYTECYVPPDDNSGGDDDDDDDGDDDDGGGGGGDLNPSVLPNIIIMQPDDLVFFDDWGRPPKAPGNGGTNDIPYNEGNGLPNLERLRTNGLQMTQAYTASAKCGTSRYSTLTGKNPSRAASSRRAWSREPEYYPAVVSIPSTKLNDVSELKDCTVENLAAAFKSQTEYKTGMFGKWHLSRMGGASYNYADAVTRVQGCGFDTVGGLYVENMSNDGFIHNEDDYSHNMEWVTYEAIKFINSSVDEGKNFMMYFNPTVPHRSQNVGDAINNYDCSDTADPNFNEDIYIEGMVEEEGCRAYRDRVVERADGDQDALGQIWVDDAVGALMKALEAHGILDDTIILFQEDHGMDAKESLYEGGIRIPQFIHYPAGIAPGTFDAPVSTVDIAPTMMEYGGIETLPYSLDGKSWKSVIRDDSELDFWQNERCLYFELGQDRGVRCGCYKYLDIHDTGSQTYNKGTSLQLENEPGGILFNLCDEDDVYDHENNQETAAVHNVFEQNALVDILECHLEKTHPAEEPDYTRICYDDDGGGGDDDDDDDDGGGECEDDANYFRNNDPKKGCSNWVDGRKKVQRCAKKAGRRHKGVVSDYCKATCGICDGGGGGDDDDDDGGGGGGECVDDANYFRNNDPKKGCSNWVDGRKKDQRCAMKAGRRHNGVVSDYCKVTCGTCPQR